MGFSQLNTETGLQQLNGFLADKAYIDGWYPSQADVAIFEAVGHKHPDSNKYTHVNRWHLQISSFDAAARSKWHGEKKSASHYGPVAGATAFATSTKKADSKDADDDDVDLFGEEEDDEEAEKAKQARLEEMKSKKAPKPGVIAKSSILLEVKPWDDETDLKEMEEKVRGIHMDGLLWGASKLVPIGYGIKKLVISCVVEDDKVSVDVIEESISAFEDIVQSVDIAAFNKI